MIGFLVSKLSSVAGPYALGGAGVVLLALLGVIGWLKWEALALEADLSKARETTAEVRTSLEACRSNTRELQNAVQRQNERVRKLQEERDVAEAAAAVRGVRVLSRERARDLPAGHGPAAMNDWLQEAME